MVQLLSSRGAHIESKDKYRATPLYIAASFRKPDLARCLLDDAAQVNVRSSLKLTSPLHNAISKGHEETSQVLLEHGAKIEGRTEPDEKGHFI